MPAPDFTLHTPDGLSPSLRDWRGQVVVLTFVYSQCTDICPLIASKLSQVYSSLGDDARRVKFVAVSTDPDTDTPISIANFSQEQGMEGKWSYLVGTRVELEPVWKEYFIDVESGANGTTGHQSRVVVIDSAGDQRVSYLPDFKPDDLLQDLKSLLAAKSG